jgi:hypothetical protein
MQITYVSIFHYGNASVEVIWAWDVQNAIVALKIVRQGIR